MLSIITRIFSTKILLPCMAIPTTTSTETTSIYVATSHLSSLATLRKKTGLPIMKCREALDMYGTLEKAEAWLEEQAHKEGLVRICLDRKLSYGAVALALQKSISDNFRIAMVELKCETDHLSYSPQFNTLTAELCNSLFVSPHDSTCIEYTPQELEIMKNEKGQCLKDMVTNFIGISKENSAIQRGMLYEGIGLIGTYVHNIYKYSDMIRCGTHIGIFHGRSMSEEVIIDQSILDRMAQHIVGMNPTGENKMEALRTQEWLFDSERTVENILNENNLECIAYYRYNIN